MARYFHELYAAAALNTPQKTALIFKQKKIDYAELHRIVGQFASALSDLDLERSDRVAVYLPKQPESVVSMLATSMAGGVFVPVNHVLKAAQVKHILKDCDVRVLITSSDRAKTLQDVLTLCPALEHIVIVDDKDIPDSPVCCHNFNAIITSARATPQCALTDSDMAAILYTSGSTGNPKGVVLSHRNLIAGAASVSEYLSITEQDTILALLPISFDYGLNQVTTALMQGATCVLMDYFLPGDVIKAIKTHGVTGLAAVPPLWHQLMKSNWPVEAASSLRYFTNSGGAMPQPLLAQLRETFANAAPVLMYGLTEAFRSTFLPPELIDSKIGSMGKAIPNAEIMVVRPDGSECDTDEPGELVHRGPHVSLGYWNAPAKTAARFKPVPNKLDGLVLPEIAVWSGDIVKKDADGFLYFVGRNDEMIKTSGYRVSPMELEDACYTACDEIDEVVACGVFNEELGQAIALRLVVKRGQQLDENSFLKAFKKSTPNFMHPKYVEIVETLPRNPNGKVDRSTINKELNARYTK